MYVVQSMRARAAVDGGLEVDRRTLWRGDDRLNARVASWGRRLSLLPKSARVGLLALLACAVAPGAAAIYAGFWGTKLAAVLGDHSSAVLCAALLVAGAVVVVFERPRAAPVAAYARQLRDRLLEIQSSFDGALRRRAEEGEERNHVVPHSSDSNR